jgi:hypothetical protein
MDFTALAWYSSAVVAVVGAVQCFAVERRQVDKGKRVEDVEE